MAPRTPRRKLNPFIVAPLSSGTFPNSFVRDFLLALRLRVVVTAVATVAEHSASVAEER